MKIILKLLPRHRQTGELLPKDEWPFAHFLSDLTYSESSEVRTEAWHSLLATMRETELRGVAYNYLAATVNMNFRMKDVGFLALTGVGYRMWLEFGAMLLQLGLTADQVLPLNRMRLAKGPLIAYLACEEWNKYAR